MDKRAKYDDLRDGNIVEGKHKDGLNRVVTKLKEIFEAMNLNHRLRDD